MRTMDLVEENAIELTEEEINRIAIFEANEKIDAIKDFDGLKIELIGTWVWVSDNTKEHKENLKMQGFRWHEGKQQWWWKSKLIKYKGGRPQSARKIKRKYGVQRTVMASDPVPTE